MWRNNDYVPAFDTSYSYKVQPISGNGSVSLDVYGALTANGTAVQQWATSPGTAQQFNLVPMGSSNKVKLTMTIANNKCVDVVGGKTADGTQLMINDCNGSASQTWFVTPSAQTGAFYMQSVASGKCMDEPGSDPSSGLRIQIWHCNGGDNQRFKILGCP